MGQHTWFYKDKALYEEYITLCNKLYKHNIGEDWFDDIELLQINTRVDEIFEQNVSMEFHDCFRTNKRTEDGYYTDDVIYSQKQCEKWLEENAQLVVYIDKHRLNKFWDKYPDGVIDFG